MRLIDADELLQKISRMLDYCQDNKREDEMSALFQVGDAVIDCHTIDPESLRPKGRWVHNEDYEDWAEKYVCSVCGRNALSDGDYRHNLSNYCPNCGAKMEG